MSDYTSDIANKLQSVDANIERFTEVRSRLMRKDGYEVTREYRVLTAKIKDLIKERERLVNLLLPALKHTGNKNSGKA
jgi:hypothetical protein